jgi:hypothetical protein
MFDELYRRWAQAVADRDRAALESLFDEAYAYTSPEGKRMTRQEIIDLEMEVPPPELPFHDFNVQQFDGFAIVRGGHSLKGDIPSAQVSRELAERVARGVNIAFTSVWRETDKGWRVVSNDAHVVGGD